MASFLVVPDVISPLFPSDMVILGYNVAGRSSAFVHRMDHLVKALMSINLRTKMSQFDT